MTALYGAGLAMMAVGTFDFVLTAVAAETDPTCRHFAFAGIGMIVAGLALVVVASAVGL